MAVSIAPTYGMHRHLYTITITADGDADVVLPDKAISNIAFESDGVDGGGTLTVLGTVNGTTFTALGFNTSADPRNATSVANATAAGLWVLSQDLLGIRGVRFHLTGATTPTLVLTLAVSFVQ